MAILKDVRISVLLALVLIGSVLSVVLALSRPGAEGALAPPTLAGPDGTLYAPADLVGPGGDALAAAVVALPTALGYDHADLAGSLSAATDGMTARYATTYTRDFERLVRPAARRDEQVTRALVRGAGVVRARDDSTVVCLLYVDRLLVAARGLALGQEPRLLGTDRLRVAMVLRDDTWKIDGISEL